MLRLILFVPVVCWLLMARSAALRIRLGLLRGASQTNRVLTRGTRPEPPARIVFDNHDRDRRAVLSRMING
ncbi:hypothetical protein ACIRRA_31120 [Nocardia sp. NPDC101769]|uniref:hypothetical protein n=1 Tax=Nocardia sp. NPDC101769 TaxID=3364333 RepID=UPI003824AB27